VGLGLLFFGPEGVRTKPLTALSFEFAGVYLSGQTILIVAAAVVFSGALFLFFDKTLIGKALRATAINRTGARLMGIRPSRTGTIAYLLGSLLAGVSGILIAPVNTIFYDSGFLLGLKAFVGAIIGGLASYPGTALGAVFVGLLESFASFQSSAFKDVIVFSMLIPILLWRSFVSSHSEEEVEE
jgi:branched-chain amino acid transport system permease protein